MKRYHPITLLLKRYQDILFIGITYTLPEVAKRVTVGVNPF
jgi:hypothetical protein